MIVVMDPRSTVEHTNDVVRLLDRMGLSGWVIEGTSQRVVEVLGGNGKIDHGLLEGAPMVERVLDRADPILAANRAPGDQTVEVPLGADATIGGRKLGIIAGPCAVETRSQLLETAAAAKEAGAVALRGGAFKPRTSP